MSEADGVQAEPIGVASPDALSAGALIRAAREKRGLHVAALAAAIKVSPRKLEALEADRYTELPDLTFTRALAHTVCRALKVDPEPVLAKLPQAGDMPKLAQVGAGLNAPFRGAPGSRDPGEFTLHRKPAFWATLLVLGGAVALAFLPDRWMPWSSHGMDMPGVAPAAPAAASATQPSVVSMPALPAAIVPAMPPFAGAAASADPVVGATPSAVSETSQSAPPSSIQEVLAPKASGVLILRTTAESWIDVQDARGQTLLSRNVQRGESVGLDGALPMRVTIGNAAVTQLVFRGQPVDLSGNTRDNVARLQLP